jgi:hypothetical protein
MTKLVTAHGDANAIINAPNTGPLNPAITIIGTSIAGTITKRRIQAPRAGFMFPVSFSKSIWDPNNIKDIGVAEAANGAKNFSRNAGSVILAKEINIPNTDPIISGFVTTSLVVRLRVLNIESCFWEWYTMTTTVRKLNIMIVTGINIAAAFAPASPNIFIASGIA